MCDTHWVYVYGSVNNKNEMFPILLNWFPEWTHVFNNVLYQMELILEPLQLYSLGLKRDDYVPETLWRNYDCTFESTQSVQKWALYFIVDFILIDIITNCHKRSWKCHVVRVDHPIAVVKTMFWNENCLRIHLSH